MPGEIEYNKMKIAADSVQISQKQFEEVNEVAAEVGSKFQLEYV